MSECYRLYCIIRVMLHYGLGEFIPKDRLIFPIRIIAQLLFRILNHYPQLMLGKRLCLALQNLGPIWIKFGQMLSTRRDLCDDSIIDHLKILQDHVEPFDGSLAKKHIEHSMGQSLDVYFYDFQKKPLASASISQVHVAKLKNNNKEVVIKVIRPDILPIIQADIRLMYRLALLIPKFLSGSQNFRFVDIISEYKKSLLCELNLLHETANTIQLRRNFKRSSMLYIPKVYTDYCSENVIVMERIYGIPVGDIESLKQQGTNMKLLAERGVDIFFTQVFRDSFFHADMHPGNVFVSYDHPKNPMYIGVDCGVVGLLNKKDKYYLAENFIAFFNRDYRRIAKLHLDSGWIPLDTNIADFELAIRVVFEPIFEKPLSDISCSYVLLNLFRTARRFNMSVQPQLILLQKTLFYIEGMVRNLYPKLNLWRVIRIFLEKWIRNQISLSVVMHCFRERTPFYINKLPELFELISNLYRQSGFISTKMHQIVSSDVVIYRVKKWQAIFLFSIGSVLVFCGVLIFIQNSNSIIFAYYFICIGVLVWVIGWSKINQINT